MDPQDLALPDLDRAEAPLDLAEGLREGARAAMRRIADVDDRDRAVEMAEQQRRGILAREPFLDRLLEAADRSCVAEKEARQIDQMDADIHDHESLCLQQIGLVGVD